MIYAKVHNYDGKQTLAASFAPFDGAVAFDAESLDQLHIMNGEAVLIDATTFAAKALAKAQAEKLVELDAVYVEKLQQFSSDYPAVERDSWHKQEGEARAFLTGGAGDFQMLNAIAMSAGVTVLDIANKVVANADLFAQATGELVGVHMLLKRQVAEAKTVAAVEAVSW